MESKRKAYQAKLIEDVKYKRRMIEVNKKSIENIKATMTAGKDLEFFKNRIDKTEKSIIDYETSIRETEAKLLVILDGGCDVEINSFYDEMTKDVDDAVEKKAKKEAIADEKEKIRNKRGQEFDRRERDESRRSFNTARSMEKEYERYLNICDSIPEYIKQNLKTMPNNKGYNWRGMTLYGELPAESGPVVLFDKKQDGMMITEITPTMETVWFKGRTAQQKSLVKRVNRRQNFRAPATVY
jgi:hypothetical protein